MGYKNTFLLLVLILISGICKGEELPANTWVKTPKSEEYKKLEEFSLMISDKRRSKSSNWLFIDKWFHYSSTAQGAWIPDIKKVLFINGHNNTTWLYDPQEGGDWKRKLARREKPSGWKNVQPKGDTYKGPLRWGSLCYDPINKEVLLFGGNCAEPGGTPGTRVYSIEKNEWKKLDFSKFPLTKLHAECEKLRLSARKLEGRLRSRLHYGEIPEEREEDLEALAQDLAGLVSKFSGSLSNGGSKEKQRVGWAHTEVRAAFETLKQIKGTVTPQVVQTAAKGAERLRAARDILAPEPTARAHSPLVWDIKNKKIVLFGGDHLDYLMSDTWIYDPKTRTWDLCRPDISPAPRGGHALVYLQKNGKVAMLGGYAFRSDEGYGGRGYAGRELELWVYDTSENKWELIRYWPYGKDKRGRRGPRGGTEGGGPVSPRNNILQAVVNNDDTIMSSGWVCRVDPGSGDAQGTSKYGVPSGTIARRTGKYVPTFWDEGPEQNPAANEKFLSSIQANTWVQVMPPKVLKRNRDWGTATFDTDRGQIIYFSGGHCAYSGTDVHVYSSKANRWRTSSFADFPVGFCAGTGYHAQEWSFNGRPFMTSHTYKLYAYDPGSKKMICFNRYNTFIFDPLTCDWEWPPVKETPFGGGVWVPKFCTMPDGLLVWSAVNAKSRSKPSGLWQFNAPDRAWKKIVTTGEKVPGTPGDDYGTLVYDSKRNRALMLVTKRRPGGPWACDLKTGTVTDLKAVNSKESPDQPREAIYLPEGDIVLFAQTIEKASIIYDCTQNKYRLLELGNPLTGKQHGYGLMYDPKRKIAWMVACGGGWPIHVMRFDPKRAKIKDY